MLKFCFRFTIILALCLPFSGCHKAQDARVIEVTKGLVESTVTGVSSGTVKAEKSAELAFGTVGRVQKLNVQVGDSVKKGEILAELENLDLKTALDSAKKNADRYTALESAKSASRANLEEALTKRDLAFLNYERSLIRAPFDGIVSELNLEEGQLSQITAVIPKPLILLVDSSARYVSADFDEVDLLKLKLDLPARIKISAVRKEPFPGYIRKIIPYISTTREQDRTTNVEFTVSSDQGLLPVGASADVEAVIEKRENVLFVPTRSVLSIEGQKIVYLYSGGTAKKTPISVGISNYERSEIQSGLNQGDRVIVPSESYELEDGLRINPIASK